LLEIMLAVENGTLGEQEVVFSDKSACCVILASNGYPQKYNSGFELKIGDIDGNAYVAGAKIKDGRLVTAGGRVVGVTAVADSLSEAVKKAYVESDKVDFENKYYRKDIGAKALKVLE